MVQTIIERGKLAFVGGMLLLAAAMIPASAQGATLHAVMVADTTDESIGSSTAIDLENVRREMQKVSLYTGLDLREITIRDREAVPDKVLEKISKLEIEADDVVVFYFSGHGFRTPSKGDIPWPNLYFSSTGTGIDYELIGQRLEERHPRFLMVIADACNNVISDMFAPPLVRKMFFMKSTEGNMEKNYRRLFLDVKGVVMVTSSRAGEYSWATNQGGLFTLAFLNNLASAVKLGSDADWFTILDLAATQVEGEQHPDFRIYLEDAG